MKKQLTSTMALLILLVPLLGAGQAQADAESIARGEYLTTILGCGGCHTEGALLGQPGTGDLWLAGSKVGIAYSEYDDAVLPGVVFPGNLTPDEDTGLGKWSKRQIVRMLKTGLDHELLQKLPVMPWPNYQLLRQEDLSDIADYLMDLPAVKREIPDNVEIGEASPAKYVRIGIFIYDPALEAEQPTE